jgi:hypothetical protein
MLVSVYHFSLVIFVFFRNNVSLSGTPTCDTLFECFTTMVSTGCAACRCRRVASDGLTEERSLRTNEGLGGLFVDLPTQMSEFRSWMELAVVMAFWALAIIFVALITGLIIDTFASA